MKLPVPVNRALHKLGSDIRDARLRRRIPTALMAERAGISRMTLNKVEKGDPGVSMGTYATVLFVLGMTARLVNWPMSGMTVSALRLKKSTCRSVSGYRQTSRKVNDGQGDSGSRRRRRIPVTGGSLMVSRPQGAGRSEFRI